VNGTDNPDASASPPILSRLMAVIEDRRANRPARSYTTDLLAGGVDMIGDKIVEEAGEVVEAARAADTEPGRQHLIREAADLMYHLFVMMGHRGVTLAEVEAELSRRFGISGIEEKSARQQRPETPS
jgi:phosphoribosyl-ATP pyrophosphohydrolase